MALENTQGGIFQRATHVENFEKIIPVVLAGEDNYGPQMYVTMLWMQKNLKDDTRYHAHLLVAPNFEKGIRNSISN
jgi:hypothetical protein